MAPTTHGNQVDAPLEVVVGFSPGCGVAASLPQSSGSVSFALVAVTPLRAVDSDIVGVITSG